MLSDFDQLYKSLNPKQKEAVDAIYGPVMVIAGPGTGKTQILALRIANILKTTDTAPENILALTFTESGVYAMRKRLVGIIGSSAYKVRIHTFHGFCNAVIKDYPDEFVRIIGSKAITEIDQIKIIEDILAGETFPLLTPFGDPTYYVRPALGMIRQLKRENVSPKDFAVVVKNQVKEFENNKSDAFHIKGAHKGKMKGEYADRLKKIEKNKELSKMYEMYEKKLALNKFYDYEDMLLEVIRVLEKNKDLLLQLQETHQFILADEHQDANAAQNKILELLSNFDEQPNLFIVGDEKQAIFRFQGASLENFLYFKNIFPHAKVVDLEDNYRSEQIILDAAHSLISTDGIERKKLKSNSKKSVGPAVFVREFSTEQLEAEFIVDDIKARIDAGTNPSHIAVIYRENKDAFGLLPYFDKANIPYSVRSDQNVLGDLDIGKLLLLFRTVLFPGKDELIGELLYADFLKCNPVDVYTVTNEAHKLKIPVGHIIVTPNILKDLPLKERENLEAAGEKILSWSTSARNTRVNNMFEKLMTESGFLDYIIKKGDSALLQKVDVLFRESEKLLETKRDATLLDFIHYIDTLDRYNVLVKADVAGSLVSAVSLMTAHKSKGLEYEYVYIVGVKDGHWGNKRKSNLFHIPIKGLETGASSIDDERRLFYVAITRAKNEVHISHARKNKDGGDELPSQFLEEITKDLLTYVDVTEAEKKLLAKPKYAVGQKANTTGILDPEFVKSKFLEQGLSVTAINNYLECPWNYFWNNLVRLPRLRTHHQMYGTAVHDALKQFFDASDFAKASSDKGKSYLLKAFEREINRMPLSTEHLALSLEKGKKSLEGYYDTYHKVWEHNVLLEYKIAGVQVDTGFAEQKIFLRGVIDKIEILNGDHVNVVDYKTRAPLSRNEIMGETKNSKGNYLRQLTFYKMLLAGVENRDFIMDSGEIDFIEPDKKGQYKKEKFEIAKAHEEKLLQEIQTVSQDILTMEFINKSCNKKDCEYCELSKSILN